MRATNSLSAFVRVVVAVLLLGVAASGSAYDAISVTGPFSNWTPKGVALAKDGELWTGVVEFGAGVVELKLTANESWDTNWGADQQVAPPARVALQRTGGNVKLKIETAGPYRFVFDPAATVLTVMADDGAFDMEAFRTGGADLPRYSLVSIAGSFNSWNPGTFKMAYEGEGWWRGPVELPVGVVEYKFPTNDNWEASPSFGGFHKDPFIPQRGKAEQVIPNNKLYVAVAGAYVASFNERTQEFAIEPGPDTIVPPKDAMKPFRFDSMMMPSSTSGWQLGEKVAMERVGDHEWEWSGPLAKGELALKFAGNGTWKYTWGEFRGDAAAVPGGGAAALDAPDIRVRVPADGLYAVTFNDLTNAWAVRRKGDEPGGGR